MWVAVCIAFGALVGVAYLCFVLSEAKNSVSTAPREDMFLCDKHGPIPKKRILHLDGFSDKPIEYCPLCWHEKMKAAKQ